MWRVHGGSVARVRRVCDALSLAAVLHDLEIQRLFYSSCVACGFQQKQSQRRPDDVILTSYQQHHIKLTTSTRVSMSVSKWNLNLWRT